MQVTQQIFKENLIMKFTDINPFSKNEQSKINKSLLSTVKKGDFILGRNVEKFEKNFLN